MSDQKLSDSNIGGDFVGRTIDGRYVIQEKIAHGGMATVYKALDSRMDRIVALKLMHPHLANGPEGATFISRFRREAKAAGKLHHPGIVTVHDYGKDDSNIYLTMQYIEGTNLRSGLKEVGTVQVGQALKNVATILRALAAAHKAGLVHRDVKPENILINDKAQLLLTDFGLARVVTEMSTSTTGTVFGTVAYLAPEIIETGQSDARSDIYSIGIMLYELIAGVQPYEGTTPIQVAFKHVNEDVPHMRDIYPEVPYEVSLLIDSFCARDENKRPIDAAAALKLVEKVEKDLSMADLLVQLPRPEAKAEDQNVNGIDGDPNPLYDNNTPLTGNVNAVGNADDNKNRNGFANQEYNYADSILGDHLNESGEQTVLLDPSEHIVNDATSVMSEQDGINTNLLTNSELEYLRQNHQGQRPRNSSVSNQAVSNNEDYYVDDSENEKSNKDGKKHPLKLWLKIVLGVLVAILIGLTIWWYQSFGPGSQVQVPFGIVNVDKVAAQDVLTKESVNFTIEEAFSDTVKAGVVIASEPDSGTSISKYGKGVKLIISKGVQNLDIPDGLVGQDVDKVTASLKAIGFGNIPDPVHQFNKNVEKGVLISVDPIEGSKSVPHNIEIKMVVSDGPKPSTLPDFSGDSIDTAINGIEEIGLRYSRTDSYSDEVAAGVVISQGIPAGATVYEDDVVALVVSKGSEFVETPNVVGQSLAAAQAALEAVGLKYSISGESILGVVQRQSTSAGTRIKRGEVVTLTVV